MIYIQKKKLINKLKLKKIMKLKNSKIINNKR